MSEDDRRAGAAVNQLHVWEVVRDSYDHCPQGDLYRSALAADQAIAMEVNGLTGDFVRKDYHGGIYEITFHEVTPVRRLPRMTHVWTVTPIEVLP